MKIAIALKIVEKWFNGKKTAISAVMLALLQVSTFKAGLGEWVVFYTWIANALVIGGVLHKGKKKLFDGKSSKGSA